MSTSDQARWNSLVEARVLQLTRRISLNEAKKMALDIEAGTFSAEASTLTVQQRLKEVASVISSTEESLTRDQAEKHMLESRQYATLPSEDQAVVDYVVSTCSNQVIRMLAQSCCNVSTIQTNVNTALANIPEDKVITPLVRDMVWISTIQEMAGLQVGALCL